MGRGLTRRNPGARRVVARSGALRSIAVLLTLAIATALGLPGCASKPSGGSYHTIRPGENLYRIGLRYGVPHEELRSLNGIRDETEMQVGTRLWIPGSGKKASGGSGKPRATQLTQLAAVRKQATREARKDHLRFDWPIKGRLTSNFGMRRGRPHEGIDLAAPRGSSVRAAESGKVIHSGNLGAYGRCVIVKHAGDYRSVYAHATKTLVRKGEFVDRGQKIATVGSSGRASGPHLHFEIRRRESPRDPMLYLP
jgi:murein DD-endopeptidase MepM/ murein hydrolase activator NlpD